MKSRVQVQTLFACFLVIYASDAHASGDPIVVYWIASAVLVQVALLAFVLVAQAFRLARIPALAAYLLNLLLLWTWVWQSPQSSTVLGTALVLVPCLIVGVIAWMISTAGSRQEP